MSAVATKRRLRAKWARGSFSINAQDAYVELSRIKKTRGSLTPAAVVADATDSDSPLHAAFEWDDARAAHQQRLHTAQNMIAAVQLVHEERGDEPEKVVYAFVHVTDVDGPRYMPVDDVRSNPESRENAMREVLAQLNGLKRRYEFLTELQPVFRAIDRATRASRKPEPARKAG